MFRWYVVNTYSGHENKVKANLEHRIESMGQRPRFRRVVNTRRRGDRMRSGDVRASDLRNDEVASFDSPREGGSWLPLGSHNAPLLGPDGGELTDAAPVLD